MVRPLTVAQVKKMTGRETIYLIGHYNSDGTPMSYRITGKIQFWKTRPNDFRIPVKRGLYEYGEVTPHNMGICTLDIPKSVPRKEVIKGRHIKRR